MRFKFWGARASDPAPLASGAKMDPRAKAGRSYTRSALGGMFKAARGGNDAWPTMPTTPDAFITSQLQTLVARSREQWANNDYVKGFHRLIRQNVVGPIGITMQAKATTARGKPDKPLNDALEDDFAEWGLAGNCDVTGKLSWRAIQCLAIETAARDGEFIIQKVYGADAGPHGFALQFIDTQRLPVWRNQEPARSGDGFIRHGIEFNRYGRPVAYHLQATGGAASDHYQIGGNDFVRVPASDIIHGFITELVGQRRGIPWAASALFRLRNVNGFEDAAVQHARAAACNMGFIQYADGYGPELDDDAELSIDAEPLSFHELPSGATMHDWSPTFPSNEASGFLKSQLRGAASGMGVPYNELANDLEGVNFSSIRQLTLDAREHYKELQEWLIETLARPVREAHLSWRVLNGKLLVKGRAVTADKLPACRMASWQPRRWTWIDPRADVVAALASMRGGLTSPSQVIREQGRDPETVYSEIAADIAAMTEAGIPQEHITLFIQGNIAGNMSSSKAKDDSE